MKTMTRPRLLLVFIAMGLVILALMLLPMALNAQDETEEPPVDTTVEVTAEPSADGEPLTPEQQAALEEFLCEQAVIPDPSPAYYIALGDVDFNRGDYNASIRHYSCAILKQPDYAPTYAARGFAYIQLRDVERALTDFDTALAIDEALIAAYINRGVLYTNQGNFGLAINDYTLALALDPSNAVAYNNRGVVHASEGNYDLALADFEQAIAADPTYATPHASMAAVYSAMAALQYQAFVEVAGENARLPAGTPAQVIDAVDDSLRDGDFGVWLSLLSPER